MEAAFKRSFSSRRNKYRVTLAVCRVDSLLGSVASVS